MSKVLSELLDQPEHLVENLLHRLESRSGHNSEDIRLSEEVRDIARHKTLDMGLDPRDTTAKELYHALEQRFSADCRIINKALGHNRNTTATQKAKSLTSAAALVYKGQEVWAVKHSSAKKILRADPPKALMRRLGYRSLESMLKHEKIELLYAAIGFCMSHSWQESFRQRHAKLTPLDFENRKLQFISSAYKKWQPLLADSPAVSSVDQLGAVVIWPNKIIESTDWLASFVLIIKSAENIHLRGLIAKVQQLHGDFGNRVLSVWDKDLPHLATVSGYSLHWRSLFNFLASHPQAWHPDPFEPYLTADDFRFKNISQRLASFHPQLRWWCDNHFAFLKTGQDKLSLNIVDTAKNHASRYEFSTRTYANSQQAFWDELIGRYLTQPHLFDAVVQEIDANTTPAELFRVENEFRAPSILKQVAA